MLHLLHDGRLFEEVLQGHGVLLERLNSHCVAIALPHRLVYLAVLPPAQLVLHHDVRPADLPLIRLRTQREDGGLVLLGSRIQERSDQAMTLVGNAVVMHQLGQGVELGLLGDEYLAVGILRDAVVIDPAFVSVEEGGEALNSGL